MKKYSNLELLRFKVWDKKGQKIRFEIGYNEDMMEDYICMLYILKFILQEMKNY